MTRRSNWQKYLDLLFHKRIPEKHRRWYVKRVEDFLMEFPGKKLQDFSARDLEMYLQARSSDSSLTAWQYRQMVDALQLLFVDLSSSSLAKTLDWGYWKEAYVQLKPEKSYLSKEISPERMTADYAAVRFPEGSDSDDLLKALRETGGNRVLQPESARALAFIARLTVNSFRFSWITIC